MAEESWSDQLTEYLRAKGHTGEDIEKILVLVERYENQVQRDSLMESIDSGSFDLEAIIAEAMDKEG